MAQRLSQAKLQRLHVALSGVIASVHAARVRYQGCSGMRPRRLAGFSAFLRELLALPHDSDYSLFEVQLKRRLVRTQHQLFGRYADAGPRSLSERLPVVYHDALDRYADIARELLKTLAEVDITTNHQHLKTVRELLKQHHAN